VAIVPHAHSPPSIVKRITWTRLGAMKTGRIQGRIIDEDSEVRLYYAETVQPLCDKPTRQPNPQSACLMRLPRTRQSAVKPSVEPYLGSTESTEVQFPLL
jgi:hypothetical protein